MSRCWQPATGWEKAFCRASILTRGEFGLEQNAGYHLRSRWLVEEMDTLLALCDGELVGDGTGPADGTGMGMAIGADGASAIFALIYQAMRRHRRDSRRPAIEKTCAKQVLLAETSVNSRSRLIKDGMRNNYSSPKFPLRSTSIR